MIRAGLIGDHIGHSRLAAALAILAEAHGDRLDFTPIDTAGLRGFDFARMVDRLRAEDWTGVTVTHPWKTHAAEYAGDGLDPAAQVLGASNLLVFGEDGVTGYNTDYTGLLGAWMAEMNFAPGRVAMAGAGGVARALGPALAALGAGEIVVWDVDPARADDLAARIGPVARAIPAGAAADATRAAEGLVNATAIGMSHHPGSAFPAETLGGQSWAFDAVYTPTDTAFLRQAAAAGLRTLTGFELFRHMALGTFAGYFGIDPDPALALPMLQTLRPAETADA